MRVGRPQRGLLARERKRERSLFKSGGKVEERRKNGTHTTIERGPEKKQSGRVLGCWRGEVKVSCRRLLGGRHKTCLGAI